jgi:hypothetical protein
VGEVLNDRKNLPTNRIVLRQALLMPKQLVVADSRGDLKVRL